MKDNLLINLISFTSLLGRFLLGILLTVLWRLGGFRNDEALQLVLTLAPMTTFFFTGFISLMVRSPYLTFKRHINQWEARFSIGLLIFFYLLSSGTLLVTALNPQALSFEFTLILTFSGEIVFAVFSASFLNILFTSRR